MVEQLDGRYGQVPAEMLVGGGFASHEAIEQVSVPEIGCTVYAPVQTQGPDARALSSVSGDGAAVGAWRERMGTAEAQAIYKERAATAECVNALARNRGLRRFLVRGLPKAKAVLLGASTPPSPRSTTSARPRCGGPARRSPHDETPPSVMRRFIHNL